MRSKKKLDELIVHLRNARKANGLSQRKLSELLGVTGNTVSFWECGKTLPTRSKRARIEMWLMGKNFGEARSKLGAFARKVKSMRLSRRMTLSEMSRGSGLSVTTLHNWENGVCEPSDVNWQQLKEWEMDCPLIKE